ncbi:hypothetical protein PSRA_0824 [Pseudoscardovia radai]|uniref:Uncharacterized protein n=1 Tax=Pseudoscardovia radai TaxID=987066 RepID=A0A261EY07_9BIFI|nr:hypothetical protein [Pseudoscardovia radai]OZG51744.1 hypothetical protein PSRA_0824 [Pseudoscardovia radai]
MFEEFTQQGEKTRAAFNGSSQPGDTVTGTITGSREVPATEFGTGKPVISKFTGKQLMKTVITIQTTLRDDPDDDGLRGVWIKQWGDQARAFGAAVRDAGFTPGEGDVLTVTLKGTKETKSGFREKVWEYKLTRGQHTVAGTSTFTQAAQQSAPAQHAQTAQTDAQAKADQLRALGVPESEIQRLTGGQQADPYGPADF